MHKENIKRLTGVKNEEDYLKSPEAQDKYQNHLALQYKSYIPEIKSKYNPKVKDETIMMLFHYLGKGDVDKYFSTLKSTNSYDKAQEAINDSIKARTGDLPVNTPIKDYIIKFEKELSK